MNNKGQALVEFVLIIPIFLLILLALIDFGNIFKTKYELQNDLDLVRSMYIENKVDDYNNYIYNNKLELDITKKNKLTTINISKKLRINTPFLNNVLGNPYIISESVTIYEK